MLPPFMFYGSERPWKGMLQFSMWSDFKQADENTHQVRLRHALHADSWTCGDTFFLQSFPSFLVGGQTAA